MKLSLKFSALVIMSSLISACTFFSKSGDMDRNPAQIGMGNPAAIFCNQLGGSDLALASGSICRLGRSGIEQWTLYRQVEGEQQQAAVAVFLNPPQTSQESSRPAKGIVGMANPASIYCEKVGGLSKIHDSEEGQLGMCAFSDGSAIEEWTLFRGAKDPENAKLVEVLHRSREPAHATGRNFSNPDGSRYNNKTGVK